MSREQHGGSLGDLLSSRPSARGLSLRPSSRASARPPSSRPSALVRPTSADLATIGRRA